MISVIIPAHNEANVIRRCLEALTRGAEPGELDIVVVCNGCSDDTASIAQSVGGAVRVIETDVASKPQALNLGDREVSGFPRFYVDADIILPIDSVRKVATVLEDGGGLAAAPGMDINLTRRSWLIRAYYRVWLQLPYSHTGMIGSGVYALSQAGRARFDRFPDIIADDGYVRLLFKTHERLTVSSCQFVITPPKTLGELVAIKTRGQLGNIELWNSYPDLATHNQNNIGSDLIALVVKPKWWPALVVYLYVKTLTRLKANWRYRFGKQRKWERDDSSREVVSGNGF